MHQPLTWPIAKPDGYKSWTGVCWVAATTWYKGAAGAPFLHHIVPLVLLHEATPPDVVALATQDQALMEEVAASFAQQAPAQPCCPTCAALVGLRLTLTGTPQGALASLSPGTPWHCPTCRTSHAEAQWMVLSGHDALAKHTALKALLLETKGHV